MKTVFTFLIVSMFVSGRIIACPWPLGEGDEGWENFFASACGSGFEVIDTTDSEWVAPGYEVVEEAVIDPLEYGEPYLSNGTPTVGVHLSFVETDTGEAWRVVFVLDRKVVVLQEGEEPVEIPVDLEIASCAFSSSGRYIVVHDGARTYTGRNAARIDTQSGAVEVFDSQPNGVPGSRNILVSNSGSVLVGWHFFDADLNCLGSGADIANPTAPVLSPSGTYCAVINLSHLYLLDSHGSILWQKSTATLGGPYHVFSPNERYLAVPLYSGLEVWDVATGETVWRDEESDHPGMSVLFADDSSLVYSTSNTIVQIEDFDGRASRASNTVNTGNRVSIWPYAASGTGALAVLFDSGSVPRFTRQWVVLDSGLMPRWISLPYSIDLLQQDGTDSVQQPPSMSVSGDGTGYIYTTAGSIHVLSIRSIH